MDEYRKYNRRTLPVILNAKLGDWAFEASRSVRFTIPSIIRAVPDSMRGNRKAWWKFIQTVYNQGFILKGRRNATEAEAAQGYVDPSTGKRYARRKTLSTFKTTGQAAHRKGDLQRVATRILKRRAATTKSFVSQFLMVALRLGKNVSAVGGKNSWKFRGIDTKLASSGMTNPEAFFSAPFRARTLENKQHEGERGGREAGKLIIAERAILAGRDRVSADMKAYIERKLQEEAVRLFNRGAI
jgi:hypothetical protein